MTITQQQTTDPKDLWGKVLGQIELNVSKAVFSTWFKNTHITKFENGVIYLGVPDQFVKDWLKDKYQTLILKILRELSVNVRSLEIIIYKNKLDPSKYPTVSFQDISEQKLPLNDLYIDKENNLNPRYDFESFVVGSFNELAFAASQGVLKNLGRMYNPLFIYGKTGHGKTHLIQAIGNSVKKNKRVYYVTSEKFSQDLISSIQSNNVVRFKNWYRKYDLLIMDDVQFLSGKEKTQEELFHLFNTLYDANKQIIFSSDQHPNYIQNLEDRLKSRFNAGMAIDIPAPDKESRTAILKTKMQQSGIMLPDETLIHVAESVNGNIRELEGALNAIVCQTQLKGKKLSVSEVKDLIKNSIRPKKMVSIQDVVKIISGFYNIEEESIYKKTRKKEVVKPRQLIMYVLREDFSTPYPTIGSKLGGRDHTTVIHSYEKIKNDLKKDPDLVRELNQIRAML
jgi:chromosomal replication initiator protein